MVLVSRREVKRVARLIKDSGHPQITVTIADDGTIPDDNIRYFYGRSDFALGPGFIVLLGLKDQTEEAIEYAITMVIRNQKGYALVA